VRTLVALDRANEASADGSATIRSRTSSPAMPPVVARKILPSRSKQSNANATRIRLPLSQPISKPSEHQRRLRSSTAMRPAWRRSSRPTWRPSSGDSLRPAASARRLRTVTVVGRQLGDDRLDPAPSCPGADEVREFGSAKPIIRSQHARPLSPAMAAIRPPYATTPRQGEQLVRGHEFGRG
jgi:hypothetical protein